jgi:hypothetical protein
MRLLGGASRLVCAVLSSAPQPGPIGRPVVRGQPLARALAAMSSAPAPLPAPAVATRRPAGGGDVWDGRVDLYALSDDELAALLVEWQQPKFRAKQILDWLYEKGVSDFAQMSNLPAPLREVLGARARLGSLALATEQTSRDGTSKYLWRLGDGKEIETVMMPYDDGRRTACISSQVRGSCAAQARREAGGGTRRSRPRNICARVLVAPCVRAGGLRDALLVLRHGPDGLQPRPPFRGDLRAGADAGARQGERSSLHHRSAPSRTGLSHPAQPSVLSHAHTLAAAHPRMGRRRHGTHLCSARRALRQPACLRVCLPACLPACPRMDGRMDGWMDGRVC